MPEEPLEQTENLHLEAGIDLERLLNWTLGMAAAFLLIALVLITCVDVVGRYFLNAPLAGAFELTEVLLLALIFTSLPLATERREHVEVDLLGAVFGRKVERLMVAFGGLFAGAVLATFSWRLIVYAIKATEDGSVTNALHIPLAPFGFLAAGACLLSAFIAFLRGINLPPHAESQAEREEGAL